MSARLFPRLSPTHAESHLRELFGSPGGGTIDWSLNHPRAYFAQTGGSPVSDDHLRRLRSMILAIANEYGFPESAFPMSRRGDFEARCATVLFAQSDIPIGEAFHDDMWCFLTAVLLPDIAAWRFPVEPLDPEERVPKGIRDRFVGGPRNVFGRLWRRMFLLCDEADTAEGEELLRGLSEDALVQITERPGLSSAPIVAQSIARIWLRLHRELGAGSMEQLTRAAMRRLSLKGGPVHIAALPEGEIRKLVNYCFTNAMQESAQTGESGREAEAE